MNRAKIGRLILSMVSGMAIPLLLTITLSAKYDQNQPLSAIDVSTYPLEIQAGYRVFRNRCSKCHGLDSTINARMSAVEWNYWVTNMESRPSSEIGSREEKQILDFLVYDQTNRKDKQYAELKSLAPDPVAAGRQVYESHSCSLCHSINGRGGTYASALDDVGATSTRDDLTEQISRLRRKRAGGNMPPLPPEMTDQEINNLVEYLLSFKGK